LLTGPTYGQPTNEVD